MPIMNKYIRKQQWKHDIWTPHVMGNKMISSFCRLELLQPSHCPIKHCKFSYKTHFILQFRMLYTEKFGLWDCSGGFQIESHTYVTRFAKTQHNDAFLEIHIFALVSSIFLKLCSVAMPMLYCKYFSSYKAR